jgi:adenylate cyclase
VIERLGPKPEPEHEGESQIWREMLDGTNTQLRDLRGGWRRLPSAPRCKICYAPMHGIGGVLARVVQHGPIPGNPLMCNACFGQLSKFPGGAEVDVSVLFADIRGSTGLAEKVGPVVFRKLLQSFYSKAAAAIEGRDGIVDKLLGDGVMALFIPVIAGENHRLRAVEAGRRLIQAVENSDLPRQGVRVGAGIQSGRTFVGVLGSGENLDFSALGDVVNTAARLGSLAGPGELLVAADVWRAAGLETDGTDLREVEVAGREARLSVVATKPADARIAP